MRWSIAPKYITYDTYPHVYSLISSHFFCKTGYRGAAIPSLGSVTRSCLCTVSNSDTACSEDMTAGAKIGVMILSHFQPMFGEHDTYMSAFGAAVGRSMARNPIGDMRV